MYGEVHTASTNEADYAAAAAEGERLAARARRRKRLLIGFWIASSIVELYFVTQYLTWVEFWRLSGKGMAAGIGFAVALFGIIEIYGAIRTWKIRRQIVAAQRAAGLEPAYGPDGEVLGGFALAHARREPAPNTWGCLDCGMRGIGLSAADHVCPAAPAAANLQRRCERCGKLVEFDATCPTCRPAA